MFPGSYPYRLCNEAIRIIDLHASDQMNYDTEKQVLLLLNRSEAYPNMSSYQLSLARKKLADYYMSHGITGSALEQYKVALTENPRLPVKKILKSLSSIPRESLVFSIDANIAGDPDYLKVMEAEDQAPQNDLQKETENSTLPYDVICRKISSRLFSATSDSIFFGKIEADSLKKLVEKVTESVSNLLDSDEKITSIQYLPSDCEKSVVMTLYISSRYPSDLKNALSYGMTREEYLRWWNGLLEKTWQELQQKASEQDAIYDPGFDLYVEKQLDQLGEDYKNSFYQFAHERNLETEKSTESYQDWARRTIQAFWESKKTLESHRIQLEKAVNLLVECKKSVADAEDLTPAEMLFLQYMHHKKVTLENVAGYWTHKYQLDYVSVLTKLISSQYLGYADLEYSLNKLRIADLKKILSSLNVEAKGKKKDLILKILLYGETDIVLPYARTYYEVTEFGKKYLTSRDYEGKDLSFRY